MEGPQDTCWRLGHTPSPASPWNQNWHVRRLFTLAFKSKAMVLGFWEKICNSPKLWHSQGKVRARPQIGTLGLSQVHPCRSHYHIVSYPPLTQYCQNSRRPLCFMICSECLYDTQLSHLTGSNNTVRQKSQPPQSQKKKIPYHQFLKLPRKYKAIFCQWLGGLYNVPDSTGYADTHCLVSMGWLRCSGVNWTSAVLRSPGATVPTPCMKLTPQVQSHMGQMNGSHKSELHTNQRERNREE